MKEVNDLKEIEEVSKKMCLLGLLSLFFWLLFLIISLLAYYFLRMDTFECNIYLFFSMCFFILFNVHTLVRRYWDTKYYFLKHLNKLNMRK